MLGEKGQFKQTVLHYFYHIVKDRENKSEINCFVLSTPAAADEQYRWNNSRAIRKNNSSEKIIFYLKNEIDEV